MIININDILQLSSYIQVLIERLAYWGFKCKLNIAAYNYISCVKAFRISI